LTNCYSFFVVDFCRGYQCRIAALALRAESKVRVMNLEEREWLAQRMAGSDDLSPSNCGTAISGVAIQPMPSPGTSEITR